MSQLDEWSLLETIFGTAPVGIGLLDPQLRFVALNETLARGNGVPREEHLGRRIDEVWPEIRGELLARLGELVETGEPFTDVEVVSELGGAPRHLLGSCYPVRAADGTISGVGVIVLDITERKLAEEALSASEQQQREILENAQVIAVIVDDQSRIVYCNPFLADLTGWTREELLGREWYATFEPFAAGEARERFLRHIAEVAVNAHADGPLLTRSGEWRLISWNNTVIRDRQGRGIGATSIGEDITERRLAEKELRTRVEEQAALRRVATLAAAEADPEHVFLSVAAEAACILGAESSAVLRFDDPETVTVVGQWDDSESDGFPMGSTIPLGEDGALLRLLRAGEPARVDDHQGLPGELPAAMRSLGFRSVAAAPVVVANRLWGALAVGSRCSEPVPADGEQRLGEFAEVLGLAVASADAREKLARSRARIVEASDEARRRIERDLHDGAQQRLVSLALILRLAEAKLARDPAEAASELARASAELEQAVAELRQLARGIHPAILSDYGLAPALEALASRMPLPVEVRSAVAVRLPPPVEVATYYVVSEGLTNVVKHAGASHASVTVTRSNGTVTVEVADDGISGADPSLGSGLNGLQDRVEALGGKLEVVSERGAGTRLRAEIPCTFVGDDRLP
ncbi:MAG TPA: PAS domain-containing protein [Gaiellaceae bacterium]|nr:PAS domain-containing protein [Gaiellaceae bacterium]